MYDASTIRIMSFSGGGTKGYAENLFLQLLIQQSNLNFSEFIDSIDVLGGVSTGAILACGYAKGLTTTEVANFYTTYAPWIFTIRSAADVTIGSHNASSPSNRPNSVQKGVMLTAGSAFYESAYTDSNYGTNILQQQLIEQFGTMTLADLQKKIIIAAVQYDLQKPVLFSNYSDIKYYISDNVSVVDAARCSSAAYPYLPKYTYNNNLYVDGAFYANNVVKECVNLALASKPNAKRIIVIDVGAGIGSIDFDTNDPEDDGGITTLFRYLNLTLQCGEYNATNYMQYITDRIYKINGLPVYYYKWQPNYPSTFPNEIDNSTESWYNELAGLVNAHFTDQSAYISDIIARWTA